MMFSVIIPTFNRREQIGLAIMSVLAQAGVEIEIIVVDDGSTDDTAHWLASEYVGQPVRVIPNKRKKGPAGARNTGILAAKGDLIALLDSDDCFLSGHLAECQQVFATFHEVEVIFGRAIYEKDGKPVDYMGPNFDYKLSHAPIAIDAVEVKVFSNFFTHLLQYGCFFNLSTVVLKTAVAQELMNEELRIAEDYEYWVRLSRTHRFACLNRPQIRYILHEKNISFEQMGSTADNAPSLIAAYKTMLAYPELDKKQQWLIKNNIADVLFSWAYRCRKQWQLSEAGCLHLQSLRFGKRWENVVALFKLLLISVMPSLERKSVE